jgi:NADH dehydrogenase/NADH:ubiquinone oxidoreductase subunit G
MISLTINNIQTEVSEGTTVLEAAQKLEIEIPTLCHDARLKPYGACRLCIVEIEGVPRPVTACTTPAVEGMVVNTESDNLYRLRRTTVELLLSDHPNDCMVCARAGDCTLQELAYFYKLRDNRFRGEMRDHDRVDENPFIKREMNKCVLCGLCVRVCDEIQGVGAIDFAHRGFDAKVTPPFEKDLDCEFCGQCISVCPTGALTAKAWAGLSRQKDVKYTDTTCSYCGCGCSITLHTIGDLVTRVSSKDDTNNNGWLCVKGRFGYEFINRPDRLKTPYLRKKKGADLEPVSWDEALDFVTSRLGKVKTKHGPDAIGGLASARCTNEENYMFQKFFRTLVGTNNVDHCARY